MLAANRGSRRVNGAATPVEEWTGEFQVVSMPRIDGTTGITSTRLGYRRLDLAETAKPRGTLAGWHGLDQGGEMEGVGGSDRNPLVAAGAATLGAGDFTSPFIRLFHVDDQ